MSKFKIGIIILVLFCIITLILSFLIKVNIGNEEKITIQIGENQISFSKDDEIFEKDLETLDSTKLIIKNLSKSIIYINDKKLKPNKTIELNNIEITEENKISVKVKFLGNREYTEYKINTQPKHFINVKATGESKYEGDYYFTSNFVYSNDSYLLKADKKGNIIFYKKEDFPVFNFKKIVNNETVRYTYLKIIEIGMNIQLCDLIILDENYKEIDRVNCILPEERTKGKNKGTDFHDSLYISDGNYILVTYLDEQVNNMPKDLGFEDNITVQNCIIQEIKDGEVLWQFESKDYPELYRQYSSSEVIYSTINSQYFGNYMHFNSYTIDETDGNLVCSFRNLDEIIKIDRKTGKIIWTLGGSGDEFGLTEEQKFSKQHSVSFLKDHSMLIYDNNAKNKESRVVILKFNENEKRIESYKDYKLDVYTLSTGSVQAIDEEENIYLVCYGSGDYRGKDNIEEINLETGEKYFTFEILYDSGIENVLKIK